MTRAISTAPFRKTPVKPRPLYVRAGDARIDEIPLTAADGTRLALTRIRADERPRPAVLLLHGHTTSADMFVLPEARNLVDVLLDHGTKHGCWTGAAAAGCPITSPQPATPSMTWPSTTSRRR